MNVPYQITNDQDDIIIRVPRHYIDEQELTKFLDYLGLETIRRRSQLVENEANRLSEDVKQGAWQQVKHLFTES
jgi:hypothetical protein